MSWLNPGAGIVGGLLQGSLKVPKFVPVDPQKEQKAAIEGNIAALPAANKLASSVNAFNQQQIDKMLESAIPGYSGIQAKGAATISDWLSGNIPEDVSGAVQRSAAGKSLAGGYAGSGIQRNLTARDLGLTSLDLMSKGLSSAESWTKTAAAIREPSMFNVSSMFISPTVQLANAASERNAKFQRDWTRNVVDWQSSLGYLVGAEMIQDDAAIANMGGSIAGSAAGSAAGGGGGGGC